MQSFIVQKSEAARRQSIDVRDLPEAQAILVQDFVDFLRGRLQNDEETDWTTASLASFAADWDNEDDAIYDNWEEHYGGQKR